MFRSVKDGNGSPPWCVSVLDQDPPTAIRLKDGGVFRFGLMDITYFKVHSYYVKMYQVHVYDHIVCMVMSVLNS